MTERHMRALRSFIESPLGRLLDSVANMLIGVLIAVLCTIASGNPDIGPATHQVLAIWWWLGAVLAGAFGFLSAFSLLNVVVTALTEPKSLWKAERAVQL